jgi:hypothetical protein
MSATYVKQQERLEMVRILSLQPIKIDTCNILYISPDKQIQKLKSESKVVAEVKPAPPSAPNSTINKKTGAPFYVMQPPKSAAHLYKEARLNKQPYTPAAASTTAPGSTTLTAPRSFVSKVWMSLLAMGLIAASIEAAVVYAKDAGSVSDGPIRRGAESNMMSTHSVAPHSQVYTAATAELIQGALTNQQSRMDEVLSANTTS